MISIFHFYIFFFLRDKDHSNGGDGIPALYIGHTGFLCISFPMNNRLNMGSCGMEKVNTKTWYNLVVSSVMENSQVRLFIRNSTGSYKKCTANNWHWTLCAGQTRQTYIATFVQLLKLISYETTALSFVVPVTPWAPVRAKNIRRDWSQNNILN